LGGTDIPDMMIALIVLMITAIFLGCVGIYFSARMRRTLPASIATYSTALGVVIGLALVAQIIIAAQNSLLKNDDLSLEAKQAVFISTGAVICMNPVSTLQVSRDYLITQQNPWTFDYNLTTLENGTTVSKTITVPLPWIVFSGIYLLISGIFFILTTRQILRVDEA
jgi:hypothetical protein